MSSIVALTACGAPVVKEKEWVWPLPPEKPRLRYVESLHTSKDVKPQSSMDTFKQLVGGVEQSTSLIKPYGVASANNVVYTTDTILGRVLAFNKTENKFVIIGNDGDGRLNKPIDVAVDKKGFVYVTDAHQGRVVVYDKDGRYIKAVGGTNILSRPTGVAVSPLNNHIYVVDTGTLDGKHHAVSVFDQAGKHLFDIGKRGSKQGEFNFPTNICIGNDGRIYIVDTGNFRIQIFEAEGKYIDSFGSAGTGLGAFARPKGIGLDSENNIYVVDAAFNNIQIFDQNKRLLLFAGNMGQGPGEFWLPAGLWIDDHDRIYVADQYNRRIQIWQYIKDKSRKDAVIVEK